MTTDLEQARDRAVLAAADLRDEAFRALDRGVSVVEVSRQAGVHRSTLYTWIHIYRPEVKAS